MKVHARSEGDDEAMSAPEPDAVLVADLRAGRRDAFEHLYADYHAPIYNLCARILGDREEAKDLTQDVFITAFSDLPAPERGALKLRPWLYRVATNACLSHLRSRKGLGGGGAEVLDAVPSRIDTFEQAQTVALVEESLGQLNERYRTALVLKDLHGLPPEEIADVMEVSRSNADVLVHRARASFKTAFAKLAGDVPAPASLGLVLAPLTVPAVLHAMPPLPHLATAAPHAVPHVAPHVVPHPGPAFHAPHGAGLLAKLGAALTTKAAITAAAATVIVGGAVGGTVAVRDVQQAHAQRWSGSFAHAWQPRSATWSKQWARWSLYSNWMRHGWPMGWNSGRWSWNSRNDGWSWQMSNGSTWSSGGSQMASSGSWSGSSWTMSTSDSYGSDWSSATNSSNWSGSSSGWSGGGSSGGSWSDGGSGGSWGGDSGGSWGSGSGGGGSGW